MLKFCFFLLLFVFIAGCSGENGSGNEDDNFCTVDDDCLFLGSNYFCDKNQNVCKKKSSGNGDSDSFLKDGDNSSGDSDDKLLVDADMDNNCNSGQIRPCYTGPSGTAGKGICKMGTQSCTQQNLWGACEGEVLPQPDNCDDTIDNDCSGIVNDGVKEGVEGCVCIPFQFECDGNISKFCMQGGKEIIEYECDPVQGSTCENGQCTGVCAPQLLGNTSYIGCDYYPTVTTNSLLDTKTFHFAVAVSNSTATEATITITQGDNSITTDTVSPSSVKIINLPWTPAWNAMATALIPNQAYRLRTTQPVTVYQFNPLEYKIGSTNSYSNDASLLLPVNVWDKEYIVASRATIEDGSGFYAITASKNGTNVTVTPSATGGTVLGGGGISNSGTGTVTMDKSSVLQVLSGGPKDGQSVDITGTKISSDKPIQVIGGHNCTYVPYDQTAACDHLEESMFPISTLGIEYIVAAPAIKTPTEKKVARFRMIAAEDGATALTYDPPNSSWPASISGLGGFVEVESNAPFKITSNKKILVAQYMEGQGAFGGTGDPSLALSVPVIQYRKDYLFHAPTNYELNFVDIIAPATATVTLDGMVVSGFTAIGNTGFSLATVLLAAGNAGNHIITGTIEFSISVYGYGSYTSYWYPGGLDLKRQS